MEKLTCELKLELAKAKSELDIASPVKNRKHLYQSERKDTAVLGRASKFVGWLRSRK